jgi:hypothetical protein
MHLGRLTHLAVTALLGVSACANPVASRTRSALAGTWGSSHASLVASDTGATLQILASGSCFGSFGQFSQPVATGSFDVPGTFTQLTGAYPGQVQYAARFSGAVSGDHLTLTVTVATLAQTMGPFVLVRGVTSSWTPCLYPARAGAA